MIIALMLGLLASLFPDENSFRSVNFALHNAGYIPQEHIESYPKKKIEDSMGIDVEAQAAVVMDIASGKLLYEKNSSTALPIASLTKLMTVYVFLGTGHDFDETVTIEKEDLVQGGKVYLRAGEIVRVKDVMGAVLVGSGNSEARTLMRVSGLSEHAFVRKMNVVVKEWGFTRTFFVEPTGLDPRNVSTAEEIALIFDKTMSSYPIREFTSAPDYSFYDKQGKLRKIATTNKLLSSYLNVKGGKTGFTEDAGYSLAIEVESETISRRTREKPRIVVVVLGSKSEQSRFQDAKALATWALLRFEW